MKTSFYFVLWILIYPLLGLIHNQAINQHPFLVALLVVWGISWALNRAMPRILAYERFSQKAPVLEEIYSGNVGAFYNRLSAQTLIQTITAIYFIVTTFVLAYTVFKAGSRNWIALLVFAYFAFGAIALSIKFAKAKQSLRSNPTPEECLKLATSLYQLNYAAYYEKRSAAEYERLLTPVPPYFRLFQIVSLLFAVAAAVFGIVYIVMSLLTLFSGRSFESSAVGSMYFLYGTLAAYFGIRDLITIIKSMRKRR